MNTESIYKLLEDNNFQVSTDSRKISGGEVFFALKGDTFDGNRFAADALDKGARVAVIDNPSFKSENTIVVDNVLAELQAAALKHRNNLNIPVLAITGTNGKTTTKELLARVLTKNYRVHYTRGNLNNHIGVPLTILSSPADTEFMIVEMGANHKGEIRDLCQIAKPGYGIITNIGKAHLEGFGSLKAVTEAKSELYDYIENEGGYVFYNENNKLLKQSVGQRQITAIPYMSPGDHRIKVLEINQKPDLEMLIEVDGMKYTCVTNLFGLYNVENILATLSVGLFFNISPERIQRAIELYLPDNNRSQIFKTGKNTLICDSYNANPVSMSGSIQSFREYPGDKKTVILGDMLELGEYEREEHEKILRELGSHDDLEIILVGKVFSSLADKYNMLAFESLEQLMKYLTDNPVRNSLVLVKASRAIGLEKIYGLM
jgi:UDP-N-acetylmuramoyl-tripeptide--D-alanyl-D-alanine ligase